MRIIFTRDLNVRVVLDRELANLISWGFIDAAVKQGLENVGVEVVNEEAKNFMIGGRPRWKAKKDGTPSFLHDTGALENAVVVGSIIDVSDEFVEVTTGPGVPYAVHANAPRPYNVVPDGEPMNNLADAFLKGIKEKLEV